MAKAKIRVFVYRFSFPFYGYHLEILYNTLVLQEGKYPHPEVEG